MAATEAFVLHTIPWRETSLIVEAFCPTEGRLGLIAKGARRPRSALRGLLQPFVPLWVRHTDKGELRVLQAAEWQAGLAPLSGEALLSGFYINELLLRLTARNDPQPDIFAAYAEALQGLAGSGVQGPADVNALLGPRRLLPAVLRRFECQLLEGLGLAPWQADAHYLPSADYAVLPTDAPMLLTQGQALPQGAMGVSGQTLLVLAQASQGSAAELSAAMASTGVGQGMRQLLAGLLGHHCGGAPLVSRESLATLRAFRAQAAAPSPNPPLPSH